MKCQTCDGCGEVAASMLATDCDIKTCRACKGTGYTKPTTEEKQKAHDYLRTTDDYLQKAAVRYKKFIRNEVWKAGGLWTEFSRKLDRPVGYAIDCYRGDLTDLRECAELIGEKIYGG